MKYDIKIKVSTTIGLVTHIVSPCIKCNSDDININEYTDNYGYISTAKCKNCDNQVKINADELTLLNKWNEENDINIVIAKKLELIQNTKKEIKQLKVLQTKRNNNGKTKNSKKR